MIFGSFRVAMKPRDANSKSLRSSACTSRRISSDVPMRVPSFSLRLNRLAGTDAIRRASWSHGRYQGPARDFRATGKTARHESLWAVAVRNSGGLQHRRGAGLAVAALL